MARHLFDPVRQAPVTAALWLALAVQAQPAPPPVKADPLDASASVPATAYTSPFAKYRPLRDEKAAEPSKVWRAANDTVARIGGWRVYAREAQQADAAAPAPAAAAAASAPESARRPEPVPAGHGGHQR